MAYGLRALRKILFAGEATAGTAVATTTAIWRGTGLLHDDREIKAVKEDRGSFQQLNRTYSPRVGGTIKLDSVEATFEQLPYILAAGISNAAASGTVDGTGGSDYIYTATLSTTAAATPKTYTFEGGDNARVDEIEYCYIEDFELSGKVNEAVMVASNWRGRQVTDSDFSATITAPTVEEILFNKGKLYLHASTFGSGQITGSWLAMSLKVKSGFQAVYSGDGSIYFTTVKQVAPVVTGSLTLEHDANGEAELTAARNRTTRYMRMTFEGAAETTAGSGSAWSYKTLQVDLGIRYTSVPDVGEQNEDDVVTLPFELVSVTNGGVFTVVNEVAALP